jgi:hypothetical protein
VYGPALCSNESTKACWLLCLYFADVFVKSAAWDAEQERIRDGAIKKRSGPHNSGNVSQMMCQAEQSAKAAALPDDEHRVLYAGPPWKYGRRCAHFVVVD